MSPLGRTLRTIAVVALAAAALASCSKKRGSSPFDPEAGHAGDFLAQHFTLFRADSGSCISCHGVDLQGGISKVSCYSASIDGQRCHPGGPGGHSMGWSDPANHGTAAKGPPGDALSGLASCTPCHGTGFQGGSGLSCFSCHGVPAPHPRGSWRGRLTHTTTHQGNAPVCAQCHDNPGNDLPPACFNNSLCHGETGHPAGWAAASSHGAAAKRAPGSMTGFEVCTGCHGSNFGGGTGRACSACHGVPAPHPRSPWRNGLTHTDTNRANAPVCARCHDNPGNSLPPNCFNGSLCHAEASGHPPGWSASSQHGQAAMTSPGFPDCQRCHGNSFQGGSSGQSCFSCHGINAPHASNWRGRHDGTRTAYASVCAQCHRSSPGTAGCFNNTLCHGSEGD